MQGTWRLSRVGVLLACGVGLLSGGLAGGSAAVYGAGMAALTVTVDGLRPGGVIPPVHAYCAPAAQGHVKDGPNRSPAIRWSKGPAGTASYAIVLVDPDVPSVFDTANKEGQTIPATLKRRDFYHWLLVDIPATVTGLPEGAESSSHAAKPVGPAKYGLRGANDYGVLGIVKGPTGGYDGPCPPWNDAIAHHYHFGVYALAVKSLGLTGAFTGPDVVKAMQGHILARGEVIGVYSLNPGVAKTLK